MCDCAEWDMFSGDIDETFLHIDLRHGFSGFRNNTVFEAPYVNRIHNKERNEDTNHNDPVPEVQWTPNEIEGGVEEAWVS